MGTDSVKLKAFELFDKLQPGEIITVSQIAKKDPKAFIEYGKAFIDQGGSIEFSKDYRKIKGLTRIDWNRLKRELKTPASATSPLDGNS
jgi:hypothetical protein